MNLKLSNSRIAFVELLWSIKGSSNDLCILAGSAALTIGDQQRCEANNSNTYRHIVMLTRHI